MTQQQRASDDGDEGEYAEEGERWTHCTTRVTDPATNRQGPGRAEAEPGMRLVHVAGIARKKSDKGDRDRLEVTEGLALFA